MQIAHDSTNSTDKLAGPIGNTAQFTEFRQLRLYSRFKPT